MWHFVLAVISEVLCSTILFKLVFCVEKFNTGGAAGISAIIAVLLTLGLHGINESRQAVDDDLEFIYGNLKNFQKDSKNDWRQALLGTFVGLMLFLGGVAIVF